jgi:hypothetical protein
MSRARDLHACIFLFFLLFLTIPFYFKFTNIFLDATS